MRQVVTAYMMDVLSVGDICQISEVGLAPRLTLYLILQYNVLEMRFVFTLVLVNNVNMAMVSCNTQPICFAWL